MKQQQRSPSRAALLIGVAALPLTPLAAQTTDTTAPASVSPPPATESVQAPATEVAPAPTMAPVVNTVPSGNEAPVTETKAAAPAPARSTPTPARSRSTTRTTAPRPTRTVTPAPMPVTTEVTPIASTPAQTVAETATTPLPNEPPVVTPPEVLPEPQSPLMAILPWLAAGILLVGGLALLLVRRRRRAVAYEQTYYEEPASVVEPQPLMTTSPVTEPTVLDRDIAQPAGFAAGLAATPLAASSLSNGRPALDIRMRPLRAGVDDADARVEFELTVGNHGKTAARDVRISAWMFPAGSESSDMERNLIDHGSETTLPEVDAGDARRIESAVAMPTDRIGQDSVLPVVVAEARYRLDDGSEERTSARFAVGVPVGEQLAHFDLENPSGLHEDVEARPLEIA